MRCWSRTALAWSSASALASTTSSRALGEGRAQTSSLDGIVTSRDRISWISSKRSLEMAGNPGPTGPSNCNRGMAQRRAWQPSQLEIESMAAKPVDLSLWFERG